MMLRMSLRDPRVPSCLRCDVGSVACKLQYPRDSQYTQLGIATSEYRSPRWIFVFAVARHLEAHRVEARRAHQHSVPSPRRLNPANVKRTFWSPKWSPTGDHGAASNVTDR